MEEAGEKIDGNIGEIKTNYSQRINKMEDIIKKVEITIKNLNNSKMFDEINKFVSFSVGRIQTVII